MSKVIFTLTEKIQELRKIPGLYDFVKQQGFVAGGAVRDLCMELVPKDYDIFFKTKEAIEEFKNSFGSYLEKTPLDNYNYTDFQFITMQHGSPDDVIAGFDWNVNMCYVDFSTGRAQLLSKYQKLLAFNPNGKFPVSAFLRLPYLMSKGFTITHQELLFASCFLSASGLLASSEKAMGSISFAPSNGGSFNINGIPERAIRAALASSDLAKAMKEPVAINPKSPAENSGGWI